MEIDCPCCSTKLIIDKKLERILSVVKKKEEVLSVEEFFKKESQKQKELDGFFKVSKKKEDEKKEYLEKKFNLAKKKREGEDLGKPLQNPFWD